MNNLKKFNEFNKVTTPMNESIFDVFKRNKGEKEEFLLDFIEKLENNVKTISYSKDSSSDETLEVTFFDKPFKHSGPGSISSDDLNIRSGEDSISSDDLNIRSGEDDRPKKDTIYVITKKKGYIYTIHLKGEQMTISFSGSPMGDEFSVFSRLATRFDKIFKRERDKSTKEKVSRTIQRFREAESE